MVQPLFERGRCLLPDLLATRGLTQSEFGRRVGRPKRMISHFCNNTRVMQPEDMYNGSLVLQCEMTDFYEWV